MNTPHERLTRITFSLPFGEVHALVGGEVNARPLLFLHGFPAVLVRIRSNIWSTRIGISITPTATSGCTPRARLLPLTKILGNTFRPAREWKIGTSLFHHRRQARFRLTRFNADKALHLNGATIALKYYGPSHTDSDVSAYFIEADVLHTGDTWWNGHYPFIDYSTGGSINGMIKAAEANLATVTDNTVVVPGHGPVGGKTEMIEYRDVLAAIRDRVAALKGEGKSLNEIVAAKPTAAYDAKWGGFFINGESFTKLVYKGVGKDPAHLPNHL
jgi:hypothetical protein